MNYMANQTTLITNQLEILKSRTLAVRVVKSLNDSPLRDSLTVFKPDKEGRVRSLLSAAGWLLGNMETQHRKDTDIIDITQLVVKKVKESEVREGAVTLFIPGSTAALTTIEFESGVVNDLRKAIDRIAPADLYYEHDERWGDGNGYAHVRAALIGPSLHIPIINGEMTLGTWQQIVLVDFDNRPRERRIMIQIT